MSSAAAGRLRAALLTGAALWLGLVLVGFVAPGGWKWGLPGPFGHMMNFMITLWLVALVAAPALASRDPLGRTAAIQVYLLGVLGMALSSVRGEPPELISDAPPLIAAALSIGPVLWAHPERRRLGRL